MLRHPVHGRALLAVLSSVAWSCRIEDKSLGKEASKQDLLRRWANRRGDRASLGDLAPAHGLNPAHGLEKAGQHRRLDQICDILTVLATHQSQQSAHCFLPGWMGPERYALLAACDYTLLPSRHRGNGSGSSSAIRISRCSTIGISSTLLGGLDHLGPARPLWSFVTRGIQPHWINVRWEPCGLVQMEAMRPSAEFAFFSGG